MDRQSRKPGDTAQVCTNGHLVLGSIERFPQLAKAYCEKCGAKSISQCQRCAWPIRGTGESSWMGVGRHRTPSYCGECGQPFPWTEAALAAAKEYTDELESLTIDEKASLASAISDLTSDTPRTPLAGSRFQKFVQKIGPTAGLVLQKIVETVATEAAKKAAGL